ncbi:MAG TPA: aldehyde:ferredoxin oxidoreductase [Chloroflexi bacterium]|nr:aldehyde:ferredoxin oxidoreductase [Chloroflexota bacterium]
MPFGYHGRILHCDLTRRILTVEEPDAGFYRKYLGGSAIGNYYLLRMLEPGVDPLSPKNLLVLSTSVMTGTPLAGQSRFDAAAKSPLTGGVGSSQAGGFWPAQFKFTGFDAVVIQGAASSPVYLWIHQGQAELKSADHLWGLVTGDVQRAIREEQGDSKIEVLQCGPAGEQGVLFSAMINDCTRANGRNGLGAVMGSKNLKAVAVRGKNLPEIADRETLKELAKYGAEHVPQGLQLYGTGEGVDWQQLAGGLPTRNYQSGVFEGAKDIAGTTMAETILKDRSTCYACPIRCKRVVEVKDPEFKVDPIYGGPEYEALAAFGSYCGVDDLKAVARANQLCNMYGMDTISCGATIAWAMECFEKGLIGLEETDGLELEFGNTRSMLTAVERIARREGDFFHLLGEGSARAAAKIGRGAEEFLTTVKKQEAPAHMPRVKRSLALIYAVNPNGADHQSHEHDPAYSEGDGWEIWKDRMELLGLTSPQPIQDLGKEKVRYSLRTQWVYSLLDSLVLCQFVFGPAWQIYGPQQIIQAVRAVTGWEVSLEELLQVGERRLNMMQAINAREGIGRQDPPLPPRFFEPLPDGPSQGLTIDRTELLEAIETYYQMAGWELENAQPTRSKLSELDLDWVADLLEQAGQN